LRDIGGKEEERDVYPFYNGRGKKRDKKGHDFVLQSTRVHQGGETISQKGEEEIAPSSRSNREKRGRKSCNLLVSTRVRGPKVTEKGKKGVPFLILNLFLLSSFLTLEERFAGHRRLLGKGRKKNDTI